MMNYSFLLLLYEIFFLLLFNVLLSLSSHSLSETTARRVVSRRRCKNTFDNVRMCDCIKIFYFFCVLANEGGGERNKNTHDRELQ